jgi:hypothetical protein
LGVKEAGAWRFTHVILLRLRCILLNAEITLSCVTKSRTVVLLVTVHILVAQILYGCISTLAECLLASEEGLCLLELVS